MCVCGLKMGTLSAPFAENHSQQRRPRNLISAAAGILCSTVVFSSLELPGPHPKQLHENLWRMEARIANHWSPSHFWAVTLYGSGKYCTELTISVFFILSSTLKCYVLFAFHQTRQTHKRMAFTIYLHVTHYLGIHNNSYTNQSSAPACTG